MLLPPSIRVLAFLSFSVWLVFPFMIHVEGSIVLKHANGLAEDGKRTVAETDAGKISVLDVSDGYNGTYHLQFITLEPSSLFLPVLLQSNMIIYVHTGNGTLSWANENEVKQIDLERGDVYKLDSGSVFYMESKRDSMGTELKVHAFFTSMSEDNTHERFVGAYSTLADLMFGFGSDVLQKAFKAPELVVDEILKAGRPSMIVPAESSSEAKDPSDWKQQVIEGLLMRKPSLQDFAKKKKKKDKEKEKEKNKKKDNTPTFNLFSAKPDFQNCNGWSLSVTNEDLKALQDTDVSIFLVNLNKGSMMGPHWNPKATEVAIVTKGKGIVKLVCPSEASECKETSFLVGEEDVFVVPRYHAMVQMSFNNDSFAFMGFTTRASTNRPQFLAGKSSFLKLLDVGILAKAFNVSNSTINQLLGSREEDSIIMDCTSCAEEELRRMEEEGEEEGREPGKEEEERKRREKEEEERERREEEESKRHEEERKRQEEEEEEKRKKEEEEEQEEKEKRHGGEEVEEEERGEGKRKKEEESKKGREEEERRHGEKEEEEEGRGEGDDEEEIVRLQRPWKKVCRV